MKFLFVYPFPPGNTAAGLNLEVVPMVRSLAKIGHRSTVFCDTRHGNFVEMQSKTSEMVEPTTRRLPPDIHEGASEVLLRMVGPFLPPIFRPADLVAAARKIPHQTEIDCVVAFKPWFRTVVPALCRAREAHAVSILWIDDYDLPRWSRVPSWFDVVVVNSRELAETYAKSDPVYLPHSLESEFLREPHSIEASGLEGGVIILFPSTGYPKSKGNSLIHAVKRAAGRRVVNVVNWDSQLLSHHYRNGTSFECRLLPHLSRHALIEIIDEQALAVVPQPDTKYGRAKASGRLLECLARGIPALVPHFGESARIVSDSGGGAFYDPDDPEGLAEIIRGLFADRATLASMSRAAAIYMRGRSSWDDNAVRLLAAVSRARERLSDRSVGSGVES